MASTDPEDTLLAQGIAKLGIHEMETDHTDVDLDQTFILQEPYLPCTAPLADLDSMTIKDPQPETHHQGKFLWLQKAGQNQVFVMASRVAFIVADHEGSGDVLEIPLSDQEFCWDDLQTRHGRIAVAVKEPFYTKNETGAYGIRVDHLSDLVIFNLPHDLASDAFNKSASEIPTPIALELKAEAKSVLKKATQSKP